MTPGESPPGFHFLNVCGFIFLSSFTTLSPSNILPLWILSQPLQTCHHGRVKSHPALTSTLAHVLRKRAKKWNQCMPDSLFISFKSSPCWLWNSSRAEPLGTKGSAAASEPHYCAAVLSSLSDIPQSFPKPHSHRISGVTWSKTLLQQGHLERLLRTISSHL